MIGGRGLDSGLRSLFDGMDYARRPPIALGGAMLGRSSHWNHAAAPPTQLSAAAQLGSNVAQLASGSAEAQHAPPGGGMWNRGLVFAQCEVECFDAMRIWSQLVPQSELASWLPPHSLNWG